MSYSKIKGFVAIAIFLLSLVAANTGNWREAIYLILVAVFFSHL